MGEDILMVARFEIKKNALVALPSEVAGKRLISFARTIRGSSSSLELSDKVQSCMPPTLWHTRE